MVLPAPGSLRGVAISADGRPVEQFDLTVRERETGRVLSQKISGAGGAWALAKMVPGDVEIFASDAEGAVAHERIALGPGQALGGLRLQLRVPTTSPSTD